MSGDRLEVNVTFDERRYIGTAPELRSPVVALATLLAQPLPSVIGTMLAAPMIVIALDWATRRRRQFAERLRQDIEHRMMAAR